MKIVIEIPDEEYKRMIEKRMFGRVDVWKNAICNGTPLPNGYGRLIGATTLKKMFEDNEGDDFTAFHFYEAIDECPAIIEEDEEGEQRNDVAEKTGLWVPITGSRSHACYCTECKHIEYGVRNAFSKEKCPNCGAKMTNNLVAKALSWLYKIYAV